MKKRSLSFRSALVLSAAVASILVASAPAKKKPPSPPPPPPPPPSTSSTYVTNYANVLDGVQSEVTPEVVQATSDGGSVALAHSDRRNVSWIVKVDTFGTPQWQKEVGCVGLPSGGYALGLSLQQTTDGGYVIGGGARDCQSNPICPYLTSIACGLIQKLDAAGNLVWSRVYSASATSTTFEDVRQTSDGGYVAVGTFIDSESNIGAVIFEVDGRGIVQWQRKIGPGSPSGTSRMHVFLNGVQPTADGGYVAAGLAALLLPELPRDGRDAEPILRLVDAEQGRRLPGARLHGESHQFQGRALRRPNGQRGTRRRVQPDPSRD